MPRRFERPLAPTHPLAVRAASFIRRVVSKPDPTSPPTTDNTPQPEGYPQALFVADSYPQDVDSASITRPHARSVISDGPTRGPTKE